VIDSAIAAFDAEPVAWTEKCEITNMQVTGLYLRGFTDNSQGRDVALYTAPPAPVSVPDERAEFEAFMEARFKDTIDRKRVKNGDQGYFAWDMIVAWIVWQGRAAMLQAGNSPVIPDCWIPVSDRMPEGMKTVITSNGFDIGQGWWDGECWKSFDCHDVVPGKVTHWMPLPAAPQQEVK
ncbi:DUF551 domain-containing protein, partial [Citrobacter freundii]|uniref:DUF551 domain-containing protein n=1 Tax=Citrobacter freundii TaxID=546 RepID=UPI003D7AACB5